MPELPDITIYLEALQSRVLGQRLKDVQILSPFLLRTAVPPIEVLRGRRVVGLERIGKRIAFGFEDENWLVLHLMIAGRLHWVAESKDTQAQASSTREGKRQVAPKTVKLANKQAVFNFINGILVLTEAGTKRRASVHIIHGAAALKALNPGGLDVLGSTVQEFAKVLASQNHTLKRALTDPRLLSGIGNSYSDEILHRARLSPVALTARLSAQESERLYRATKETLTEWIGRQRAKTGNSFPENVTAFQPEMAVHGKFGQPCPVCGTKVQRIRYADNETNYCPHCQTGGKLLADRSLSLLLKRDWPKTLEELEEMRAGTRNPDQ